MLDIKVVRKRQTDYPAVFKAINSRFLNEAGIMVVGEALKRVPVDSSRLANSIKYKVNLSKGQVVVGTNVNYAASVEYGTGIHAEGGGRSTPWSYFSKKYGWVTTKGNVAKPYLRPALDTNRKKLVKRWADIYNKVFAVLGGRSV